MNHPQEVETKSELKEELLFFIIIIIIRQMAKNFKWMLMCSTVSRNNFKICFFNYVHSLNKTRFRCKDNESKTCQNQPCAICCKSLGCWNLQHEFRVFSGPVLYFPHTSLIALNPQIINPAQSEHWPLTQLLNEEFTLSLETLEAFMASYSTVPC